MKTIDEYLEEQINEQLCQAILSGSRGDGPSKVKIRPVEIRGKVVYQASETVGTKVLHKNYSREELISYLKAGLQHDFSQLQASGMALDGTILVSKKGKMTIKTRRHPENGKGLAFGKDKTFSKGTQIHLLGEDHGNVPAAGRSGMQGPVSGGERRGVRRISGLPTERSYERVSEMRHERPGVYSVYDASSVTSAGRAAKRIGVAALAVKGTANTAVTLTGYGAGVEAVGEDGADTPGMSTLLKLLFANGASTVCAVRVDTGADLEAYQAAFAALTGCDVQVVVCDSSELTIQKALKTAVETASAARGERIGVIGGSGDTAAQLVTRAEAINSERMVLVGPDMKDESGKALSGVFAAAAVAGAIACGADPAVPLNGAELYGIGGLQSVCSDNDIDLLVQGGVTPLEDVGGVVSPVRGITTRTKTGSAADSTWRELTTVLIADDVIPAVRSALRSKFARAKNTAQGRGAIRAQTIVELEKKKDAQIIESYGEVAVTAAADDPTVCLVEFSFAVAHGLNQIRLTVHLTV